MKLNVDKILCWNKTFTKPLEVDLLLLLIILFITPLLFPLMELTATYSPHIVLFLFFFDKNRLVQFKKCPSRVLKNNINTPIDKKVIFAKTILY